jgi:hypothetical protein
MKTVNPTEPGGLLARDDGTYDFSLILGGPLYQLLRRAYLSGDALEKLVTEVLKVVF